MQSASGVNIAYLELLDCGIGQDGCRALADVLTLQKAPGLLTLNLDCNLEVGDAGVNVLVDGLFNNTALKVRLGSRRGSSVDSILTLRILVTCSNCIWTIAVSVRTAASSSRS